MIMIFNMGFHTEDSNLVFSRKTTNILWVLLCLRDFYSCLWEGNIVGWRNKSEMFSFANHIIKVKLKQSEATAI